MEDGLGVSGQTAHKKIIVGVLILVLVEDGLGVVQDGSGNYTLGSLNPCFGGRWSRRALTCVLDGDMPVLILVLVEDGLGELSLPLGRADSLVLILVLVEDGLGAYNPKTRW